MVFERSQNSLRASGIDLGRVITPEVRRVVSVAGIGQNTLPASDISVGIVLQVSVRFCPVYQRLKVGEIGWIAGQRGKVSWECGDEFGVYDVHLIWAEVHQDLTGQVQVVDYRCVGFSQDAKGGVETRDNVLE